MTLGRRSDPGGLVEAAGGVLWRPVPPADAADPASAAVEVALVHRPKYDDWSLPKGKLDLGEHPLLAALREIEEETGARAAPGEPLGETHYVAKGRPKRVRYWACRRLAGDFEPGPEVDEVVWLPPEQAQDRLGADRDRPVLARFASSPRSARALVVVRHASAGDRDTWPHDDADRPLDSSGERQAGGLTHLLAAYGVRRVASADVKRCRDTVAPYAAVAGIELERWPAVTAAGFRQDRDAAVEATLGLATGGVAAALCGQREVIPDLVADVSSRLGLPTAPGELAKGSMLVLHLTGEAPPRLVALEHLPPAD